MLVDNANCIFDVKITMSIKILNHYCIVVIQQQIDFELEFNPVPTQISVRISVEFLYMYVVLCPELIFVSRAVIC